MDIPLEEDDSSDEEYQPEDEDEDETAEEVNMAEHIWLYPQRDLSAKQPL